MPKLDDTQVTRGLIALMTNAGNAAAAARQLNNEGHKVTAKTLSTWRDSTHAARYRQLEQTHGRQIEDELVTQARHSALLASQLEQLGLEAAINDVRAARTAPQDLAAGRIDYQTYNAITRRADNPAQMAVSASKVKGMSVDQVLKLTGRPTEVVEHRNADDILDRLAQRLGITEAQTPVDATAVDDTPRELAA